MHEIEQLQLGDAIYIQTQDGWYTYRFRDLEYVTPETVDVLAPVPHQPEVAAHRPHRHADELQPALLDGRAHRRVRRASSPGSPPPPARRPRSPTSSQAGSPDMYAALWRVLPGPGVVAGSSSCCCSSAALVFALFTWVFPWVDGIVNPIEVTVE